MRSVMPGIISAVPRHAWCHPAHFMRIDLGLMTAPLSPQTTAAPRAPGSWWLLLSPANTSLSSEIVTAQDPDLRRDTSPSKLPPSSPLWSPASPSAVSAPKQFSHISDFSAHLSLIRND